MRRDELARLIGEKLESGALRVIPGGGGGHQSGAVDNHPLRRHSTRSDATRRLSVVPAERSPSLLVALTNAARVWAHGSVSSASARAGDVRRDKLRVAREFFLFLEKDLIDATPMDITAWLEWLERERKLAASTIYTYCSHLAKFFDWLRAQAEFVKFFPFNPVRAAFPACPKAFQSPGTRALSDEALQSLWLVMENARRAGGLVGLRDYAMFLFFAATGDRRSEIANLRGSDIELSGTGGGLIYYPRAKGGDRTGKRIDDREVAAALVEYLKRSGRRAPHKEVFGRDVPVWLAHDRAAKFRDKENGGLTGHAFARRMEYYAEKANISGFHLHRLRHTFARIVAEETGSLSATQEALGHKNMQTTKIYVERVKIRADVHSGRLKNRIVRVRSDQDGDGNF